MDHSPRECMETITVRSAWIGPNGKKSIKATIVAPGLAVHSSLSPIPSWEITHIRSGKAIGAGSATKKRAVLLAKALSELGNWDRPASKLPKGLIRSTRVLLKMAGQH